MAANVVHSIDSVDDHRVIVDGVEYLWADLPPEVQAEGFVESLRRAHVADLMGCDEEHVRFP